MRKTYPSDVSREQFEKIRPLLESARRKTKPRTLDLYEVFCALLYVLKSGCQWAMLPEGFPNYRSVHHYFQIWNEQKDGQRSVLEEALKKISWRGPHLPWSFYADELLHR
jgi:transposase